MIIGLTIRDNDYQDIMERFAKRLANGAFIMENPPTGNVAQQNAWYRWYMDTDTVCKDALRAEKPTEDQKKTVIDTVKRSWRHYVSGHDSADYLRDRLEVTLPESVTAEWRNGEQFYVFPTSYADHVLCF